MVEHCLVLTFSFVFCGLLVKVKISLCLSVVRFSVLFLNGLLLLLPVYHLLLRLFSTLPAVTPALTLLGKHL